jgi:hypothetical protein
LNGLVPLLHMRLLKHWSIFLLPEIYRRTFNPTTNWHLLQLCNHPFRCVLFLLKTRGVHLSPGCMDRFSSVRRAQAVYRRLLTACFSDSCLPSSLVYFFPFSFNTSVFFSAKRSADHSIIFSRTFSHSHYVIMVCTAVCIFCHLTHFRGCSITRQIPFISSAKFFRRCLFQNRTKLELFSRSDGSRSVSIRTSELVCIG